MKAIIITEPGDTGKLQYTKLPIPQIGDNEVLVQVKAISINPVDTKTRGGKGVYGRLKTENPLIIGWDIAGVITETGSGVTGFKVGDEVFGMVNFPGHGKAYAEYVAAPASHLAIKPKNISFEEAAASTLAALTAYQALVKKASVSAGQRVLVHAASGGVGHYAVQMAKHFGAYVIATSSAKNRDFVLSLGADEHVDYNSPEFNDIQKVDLGLDFVGGDNIARAIPLVKENGTLISIPSGLPEDALNKAKEQNINAFFFLVESNGGDMQAIAQLLEKGAVKAHVSASYPFERMGAAHEHVESGRTVGKVVVTV